MRICAKKTAVKDVKCSITGHVTSLKKCSIMGHVTNLSSQNCDANFVISEYTFLEEGSFPQKSKQAAICGCGFHLYSYSFLLCFPGQARVEAACKIFLIN